jgi:hypothetical protein
VLLTLAMMNKYTTTLPASQQQDLATLQSFISTGGQSRDSGKFKKRNQSTNAKKMIRFGLQTGRKEFNFGYGSGPRIQIEPGRDRLYLVRVAANRRELGQSNLHRLEWPSRKGGEKCRFVSRHSKAPMKPSLRASDMIKESNSEN